MEKALPGGSPLIQPQKAGATKAEPDVLGDSKGPQISSDELQWEPPVSSEVETFHLPKSPLSLSQHDCLVSLFSFVTSPNPCSTAESEARLLPL